MLNDSQLKVMRVAYRALRENRAQLKEQIEKNRYTISSGVFSNIRNEIQDVEKAIPDLIPWFDDGQAECRSSYDQLLGFKADVVLSYVERVIARLEIELSADDTQPVIETRTFPFVNDQKIREIVERDYLEIQRAFVADCWKSAIILSGGAIEALLVDMLTQDQSAASVAKAAPKSHTNDLNRWGLSDLIAVAIELKKITEGAQKLSDSIRDYRNLVHPGNEVRSGLVVGKEEARIAIEVLHLVHRDLSQ